jgi:hypothetical protein
MAEGVGESLMRRRDRGQQQRRRQKIGPSIHCNPNMVEATEWRGHLQSRHSSISARPRAGLELISKFDIELSSARPWYLPRPPPIEV